MVRNNKHKEAHRVVRTIGLSVGVIVVFVSGMGCGRPAGEIFPVLDKPMTWPLPPDQPRVRFVGALGGEADLKAARSGWQVLSGAMRGSEDRPARLIRPQSLAVSAADVLYVADTGSASLHVLDLVGRKATAVRQLDQGERLRSPVGVALGRTSVYVTDAVLGDVFEFGLDGSFRRRFGVELERPGGIAFCDVAQRLYVVDTARHECVVFSVEGNRLFSFGARGTGDGEFNFPTHVHCSELLGVWISDTLNFRVSRFGLDGTFVHSIGGKGDGAGDLSLPKGVAVDGEGNVYVVDAQFENVQIFREDGRLLMAFGDEGAGPGQFAIPGGMTIDGQNRIWVADAHNGRVQVFQYLSRSEG